MDQSALSEGHELGIAGQFPLASSDLARDVSETSRAEGRADCEQGRSTFVPPEPGDAACRDESGRNDLQLLFTRLGYCRPRDAPVEGGQSATPLSSESEEINIGELTMGYRREAEALLVAKR